MAAKKSKSKALAKTKPKSKSKTVSLPVVNNDSPNLEHEANLLSGMIELAVSNGTPAKGVAVLLEISNVLNRQRQKESYVKSKSELKQIASTFIENVEQQLGIELDSFRDELFTTLEGFQNVPE